MYILLTIHTIRVITLLPCLPFVSASHLATFTRGTDLTYKGDHLPLVIQATLQSKSPSILNMTEETTRKIAVVTGASSGIGYAITNELAKNGYKVIACARRTGPMETLAKEYESGVVVPYQLDVTEESEILELKRYLASELPYRKLDLLYNNAGQSCTFPALDVTNEMIEQCFKVNVFSHANMCRELSQFVINAKGTIVFTGSIAGIGVFPFSSIYAASKAAIHQYARDLHLELKPLGVRVINAVTGGVSTDIADKRPLPATSMFNFKEGIEVFQNRQLMAKKNSPMTAEHYAEKLVQDILSDKDPVDVYRGTFASTMSWIVLIVPYWILEFFVSKKFKLNKVYNILKQKKE